MAPTQSAFMSVDQALTLMLQRLQQNGSKITDFNTGSGARDIFEAVAVVASQNSATADQLQLDSYLDTATGDALDAIASNWFVARNPAVQAAGQITITRQNTAGALTLQAGWSQLATTPASPGDTGIAVVTTQDANFANGQASVTVNAQAVLGGQNGNLSVGTFLTPLAPINGISNSNGYQVTTAFTNGVDVESDDAFRARIPITVQGRQVKGRKTSFLAAALGVPGVLSASVIGAGQTRGDGTTVPVGSVEVYYQGSSGLLTAVQSAVGNAAYFTQNASAFAAVSLSSPRGQRRVVATVTVYCFAGTDPVALALSVTTALQNYVNGVGLGNTAYYSKAVDAILAVEGVVSVGLPLTQFSLSGGSGAADITTTGDAYPNLAAADVLVTVNTLS